MFGSLGVPELLLIFVVILIVFGPRRIPEIGRTLGKALGEFRKATDDLKSTIEREVRLEELKKIAPAVTTPFESVSRNAPVEFPPVLTPSSPAATTAPEITSGPETTGEPETAVPEAPAADVPSEPVAAAVKAE